MKKSSKIIIFCASFVAIVAVLAALCFVFAGTEEVTSTPSSVRVEVVDGENFVVAQFSPQWAYRFQIEQEIDGEYVVVQELNSDVNMVSLSDCKLSFVVGCNYRFCACYTNGNITGKWSEKAVWKATFTLETPSNLREEGGILLWDEVENAETYTLSCVDGTGSVTTLISNTNSVDLALLDAGNYQIYVMATSSNENLFNSNKSAAFSCVVE